MQTIVYTKFRRSHCSNTNQKEARRHTASTQKVHTKVRTEVHTRVRIKVHTKVHTQVREKYRRWYMSKYAARFVNLAIQCHQKSDECDEFFKQLREEIMLLCSARTVSKQMS